MENPDVQEMRSRLEAAFEGRGVSRKTWECGELRDNACCLMWVPGRWAEWRPGRFASGNVGRWQAGFSERGEFSVVFQTEPAEDALQRFVDWVSDSEARARADAETTARWLAAHLG